jgi:isoleucyl-tRNA synthetase
MKADLNKKEPQMIETWENQKTYQKLIQKNKNSNKKFIFHDGPPYANGNIHIGHTLNKVLKDIVVKYKNMNGFYCEFIPGWDCHGLPIEIGVEKQLKEKKIDKTNLSKVDIRKLASEFADFWIDKQRTQFKRLGVLADWENPYLTKSKQYVANIIRELGLISQKGSLYKGTKPVYWSWAAQTALAEAEVEYKDHESPSIYVTFKASEKTINSIPEFKALLNKPLNFVIWTTTPWTIPANLALSLNPEFQYCVIETETQYLIVAEGLVKKFCEEIGISPNIKLNIDPKKLEGLSALHPLFPKESLIILGDHVTLEAGTGIVHTAPGHGVEDYLVGLKYNLTPYCPVDSAGRFTNEIHSNLSELIGVNIFDANPKIIELLKSKNALLKVSQIKHSYPHCWRTNKPVIFRATPQWFISMEKTKLRERSIQAIHQVEWVPQWGINRILSMMQSRPDWCISRQRIWGVPITIFYDDTTNDTISSKESFDYIASLIEEHGPDIWYEWPVEKLLKPNIKFDSGKEVKDPSKLRKETDILDVWFDSGVSHAAVLASRGDGFWPADLYLEGSDQHRGWFQTSLLTAVETRNQAPYKKVLTHGFVNDEHGKKMSKSKGNVTDPIAFANQYGAEILRLWVVVEDYRNDVNFSMQTIDRITESYRKFRNTLRYALGNLYDYKLEFEPKEFCELDIWALYKTKAFLEKIKTSYENYEFHTVYHVLNNFCVNDLSAIYFDILKDRLYTSSKNAKERKSSQAALYRITHALLTSMAPIMSFTCEEAWQHFGKTNSIFEESFPLLDSFWQNLKDESNATEKIQKALDLRELINKAIEEKRQAKEIGHNLEAEVELEVPQNIYDILTNIKEDLARLYIVSSLTLKASKDEMVKVRILKASGTKCERCWVYSPSVGKSVEHPTLCSRCVQAVKDYL